MHEFPIDSVREAFPALAAQSDAGTTIFLDNPAGTQVPRRVADAVAAAMLEASSNLGGYFTQSRTAEGIWRDAHEAMADMLGAGTAEEIVIGPCMTALTLHMSRGIGRELSPGDEIIVTRMDHEGDISPWLHLAQDRRLVVKWLPFNRDTWRNYAYEPVRHLGLGADTGVMRIGLAHYNTAAEVEQTLAALESVIG